MGHNIEDVATPRAFKKNPQLVLDFYNMRRKDVADAKPNKAHHTLAELEKEYNVIIITQNIDDLHERAGSTNVIHLHGEIFKMRSSLDETSIHPIKTDIQLGDTAPDGAQWRPHIVWFGEDLDPEFVDMATKAAKECDVCIVVGTSMKVSPANTIPFLTKETAKIYYVDLSDLDFYVPEYRSDLFTHYQELASTGMEKVKNDLKNI
jgi:NAD-dependent deacetylase